MLTILYIVFVVAFAYLTWQTVGVYRNKRSSYTLLLLIVLAGLAYDVLIILLSVIVFRSDLTQKQQPLSAVDKTLFVIARYFYQNPSLQ